MKCKTKYYCKWSNIYFTRLVSKNVRTHTDNKQKVVTRNKSIFFFRAKEAYIYYHFTNDQNLHEKYIYTAPGLALLELDEDGN